ncbi:MAG TPA: choice-of-anchor D domain-containing protein, partial [Candidatus Kapabacteria bacterium]
VYGLGNVDSYAYTGGTLLKTITPFKTDDIVIDFKDRQLNQKDWTGQWDSVVSLQNISSDSLTIFYFQRRTGDTANFTVEKPNVLPHNIAAFAKDNMTLRFNPLGVPNIRMRTTINAKTEHLRAYVVDVYGRGIVGLPMSYVDSNVKTKIDTIYFGIHGENSPPVDRFFYLGNTGTAPLNVHQMKINGPDAKDFSVLGSEDLNTNPLNVPYKIGLAPEKPVRVNVRFTPSNPRAPRVAFLDINDTDKVDRRVVLIAIVDTVTTATVTPVVFDSLYICDQQDKVITITNANTFSVTLQRIDIVGAPEFIVLDGLPIVIGPNSSRMVRIRFAPNSPGIFTASLTAYFDLPTNATQTLSLTAVGKEPVPFFWAPRNIHILAEEEVLYPIYAKVDLARMVSSSYTVDINYDPTHLEDLDVVQDNSLSLFGYFMINGFEPGSRQYTYQTADGSIIRGGGEDETRPLIFIKFKSMLNGADRLTISDQVDINYTVTFKGSPLPVYCQAQSTLPGRITIDSSCEDVHIVKRLADPFATYIHQPTPNPATNGYIDAKFDIPTETAVKMVLVDALGQIAGEVVNEVREQGRYTAHISTAGLANGMYTLRLEAAGVVKFRKIIVSK